MATPTGTPVGEVPPPRRRFVSRELLAATFASAPAIDPVRFRADVDAGIVLESTREAPAEPVDVAGAVFVA